MSEENFNKFIDGLADDLEPVKPLAHPLQRILPFFIFAVMYVGALVYFVGVRHDILNKFSDPSFLIENALMVFILVTAGLSSSFLSVPDMRGQKWLIALPFTGIGVFCVWSLIRAYTEGLHMPQLHLDHCMGEGVFMAVVPLTMVLFMMKKGATTRPRLTALMNLVFAAGLGYVGLRFTCMMDTVGHATISHLLPYLAIGTLMGMAAKKLYKW